METYTVLAWLPGTNNMCVKDRNGQVGWMDGETGEFREMFTLFFEAAVYKYGYHALTPQVVGADAIPGLLRELQAKHNVQG